MRKITLLVLFAAFAFGVKAQGLQFNQWQYAPALLNPALTGAYEGTFRVGGILKEKWQSVGSGWKTAEGFVDAPIIRGLRKQDWIGVGMSYAYDLQGERNMASINTQIQRVSLAYHLGMGTRKLKKTLSIGFQFGNTSRKFDTQGVLSEENIANGLDEGVNPLLMAYLMANEPELSTDFRYFGGGFAYNAQTNKTTQMSFGLNVSQFLNNNKQNFVALASGDLETRFTGFFAMRNQTSKKTTFEPRVVFTQQGKNNKLYTQAIFGYMLKNKMMLKYGAGFNTLNDDFNIPIYLGIEKGNLRVGLAYDVDLGATAATSTYGGLELAASYIHILAKKPEPKRILICPRL